MSKKNQDRPKFADKEKKRVNNLYNSDDKMESEEEREEWDDEWEDLYEENFMQNRRAKIRRSEKRNYREV